MPENEYFRKLNSARMMMQPDSVLKQIFGYGTFRGQQSDIIQKVINGKDVMVLMPTGGGKSLCYQVPALCLPGLTIVISPLIALMKDQVDALRVNGVEAAFLNSTQDHSEQSGIIRKVNQGIIKLLYIAPERINDHFWQFLSQQNISLFAVDEAHCISHWGHDFRPDYLYLSRVKSEFPTTPLMALTATADTETRKDILKLLNIENAEVFISSFNRPNIRYTVKPKKQVMYQLLPLLKNFKDESGIIYCLSRKSTESLASELKDFGFKALPYHAGLSQSDRQENQDKFQHDEVQIIVATIAFGMGIDKSNVRFVVHMDLPKNIESYYQETGRAGRDGLPSEALLFYSYADVAKLRRFVEVEENQAYSDIMLAKLDKMATYGRITYCRRKFLLNYFDEKTKSHCGNCDVCLDDFAQIDATKHAQMVMSAIVRLDNRFGMNYIIDFLKGSQSAKIWDNHKSLPTYGVGKELTKPEWQDCIRAMIDQEYLNVSGGKFPLLTISNKGKEVLFGKKTFQYMVRKVKEPEKISELAADNVVDALFKKLKVCRINFAVEEKVPAYIVLSDSSLMQLATYMPVEKEQLIYISGFGQVKIQKYGEAFLKVIRDFMDERGLTSKMEHLMVHAKKSRGAKSSRATSKSRTDSVQPNFKSEAKTRQSNTTTTKVKTSNTYDLTLKLAKQNLSIEEIADQRQFSPSTIEGHVAFWIKEGELKAEPYVDSAVMKEIEIKINQHGTQSMKLLKDHLPEFISYRDIKITVAQWTFKNNN